MGGGKTKAHESFVVAPASMTATSEPVVPDGLEPLSSDGLDDIASPTGPAAAALDAFSQAVATTTAAVEAAGTPAELYAALKAGAEEAAAHLAQAGEEGLPPQLEGEHQAELKQLSKSYLSGLEPDELAALAAAAGFEHPSLVGLNTPAGGQHALVHWLDPAYPPGIQSKLAIQAKASERYAALAAGETIGGLTLANVQAAESAIPPPPPLPGAWAASPADVVAASAQLHQALADFTGTGHFGADPSDGGLGALLKAENRLATASCPELGEQLGVAKGVAKASVDKTLKGLNGYARTAAVAQVMGKAHAYGAVSDAEAKYLTPTEQLALLRSSTSAPELAGLQELAATRAQQLATLQSAKATYQAMAGGKAHLGLGDASTTEGQQATVAFAGAAGDYLSAWQAVAPWGSHVAASAELSPALSGGIGVYYVAGETTQEFRSWAKTQKLGDLRAVATTLGMTSSAKASRAQVQNFIAASWDSSHDKASINAAATAGAVKPKAPKAPPSPMATGVSASPVPTTAGAGSKPPAPPAAKSFAAKHLQIVEALKAHQALAADLPARPPASEVATWSFGPAKAANLGGGHTKSLHTAPDGSVWMFKPDKTAAGARAHAEAQASTIFSRVGVPSVAVYARSIDGKMGSIQPLVAGATTLSADTKSWSQTDVDNVVRYHVAAWAVGDHDGNPANVIRTPSGGLCPVDQGQAFKFYGRDKLAVDYHPNDSFGSIPVFHQAYKAAKAGGLASGVTVRPEAALPTIKAFEAMPEAQYRAILAPVATQGVAHGVHWVAPMRKAAQKRLGKPQVSNAEVAEEFLRTAVARKNGLRGAFASFFTTNGFSAGSKLEKVA